MRLIPSDSCLVYQEYAPDGQSEEALMNWTGFFQAKGIGIYARTTQESVDYLRAYRRNGRATEIQRLIR
jgi:hypothetical protein